jgi:Alpha/beta hydrolase family
MQANSTPLRMNLMNTSMASDPSPSGAIGVVTGLLPRFGHVVLSAFGATTNGPSAPVNTPAVWSLLAFARREFDPDARAQSMAMTSAVPEQVLPAAPVTLATVFDLVETVVNTVFNSGMRFIEGPPQLPPGSTVTVKSSTLQLPCSTAACTVNADWYFPDTPNPQGIIYFQHGAIANSAMYSYTAAELAEQTNSIVVAPTLPTFYTTDGYWLGGAAEQQAVADLFLGDRAALTASASAAAGHPVTLPQKVVLVGHSEGGGLVVGAANDMATGEDAADLAGVIMLDGSTLDRTLIATAASNMAENTPILLIASRPSFWNQLGATASDLVNARPDQFVGVQIVGGTHADSVQGGNAFIQAIEQLVAGPSQPQNVDAVTTLASGWINDMYTHAPVTGTPGPLYITTDAGTATAIALPAPPSPVSLLDVVLNAVITFGTETFYGLAGSLRYIPL